MKITDSKTFCPSAWNELRIGINGAIGICSYSNNIGNTNVNSISEILNNDVISEIRSSMSNDKWHPNCQYCENNERNRNTSQRLQNLNQTNDDTKHTINENPSAHILQHVSINWNNLCNLACNYCGPEASSEWSKYSSIPLTIATIDKEPALEYLLANQHTIQGFLIGGGEPLLQKTIYQLLDNLSPTKTTQIAITTNLSVPLETNPMFNSIIKHPNLIVLWMISFDNLDEKFEYVRHNAKWDIFYNNIAILKKYNQQIVAHPAYSLYCALELEQYYKFCFEHELNIFWCELFNPRELNLIHAPTAIKTLAIDEINKILTIYSDAPRSQFMSLDILKSYKLMIENSLNDNNTDYQKAEAINHFNNKIETILVKDKSFSQLWPNIQQILNNS